MADPLLLSTLQPFHIFACSLFSPSPKRRFPFAPAFRVKYMKPMDGEVRFDLQGGFDRSKKSGVGVDFALLVRSLQVRNKGHARKSNMYFR